MARRPGDQAHRYMRTLLDGIAETYPAQIEVRDPARLRLRRQTKLVPRWAFSDWFLERGLQPTIDYRLVEAGLTIGYPLYVAFKDPVIAVEFRLRWT